MGGIIGMIVACSPALTPIRKLVLNDIGPFLAKAGLERTQLCRARSRPFRHWRRSRAAAIRKLAAPFRPWTDEQWRKMAKDTSRSDGGWGFAYDPAKLADASRPGRSKTLTRGRQFAKRSGLRRWFFAARILRPPDPRRPKR